MDILRIVLEFEKKEEIFTIILSFYLFFDSLSSRISKDRKGLNYVNFKNRKFAC